LKIIVTDTDQVHVLALEFPQISIYVGLPDFDACPRNMPSLTPTHPVNSTPTEQTNKMFVRDYHRFNEPCAVSEAIQRTEVHCRVLNLDMHGLIFEPSI